MSTNLQRENEELRLRLRALEQQAARVNRPLSGQEADELKNIRSRFDFAGATILQRPSSPGVGETPLAYRRRLNTDFAKLSPKYEKSRFDFADAAMLETVDPFGKINPLKEARRDAHSRRDYVLRMLTGETEAQAFRRRVLAETNAASVQLLIFGGLPL